MDAKKMTAGTVDMSQATVGPAPPKKLIPIDKWNIGRAQEAHSNILPRPNGIACPQCGSELLDSSPSITLTSDPPQKRVHCQCGYAGTRIA
jgi:hypothetical protein